MIKLSKIRPDWSRASAGVGRIGKDWEEQKKKKRYTFFKTLHNPDFSGAQKRGSGQTFCMSVCNWSAGVDGIDHTLS